MATRPGRPAPKFTYAMAVREGRKLAKANTSNQWAIADLALRVAKNFGMGRLEQLAEDTGLSYETLTHYRRVARAFPKAERNLENTFAVHHAFAAQPDRAELVKHKQTRNEARTEVKRRNEKDWDYTREFSKVRSQIKTAFRAFQKYDWEDEQTAEANDLAELFVRRNKRAMRDRKVRAV